MGSEDKTPKPGSIPPPVAQHGVPPYFGGPSAQAPPQPHHHPTNPYGVPVPGSWPPFTPWPQSPETKKDLHIPDWLKFAVTAVLALLAVGGYVWKGGAIVQRFESLEKKVDQATAQSEVREKARDLREQLKDGADSKWREEINAKLSRMSVTGGKRRRAAADE